MRYQWFCRRMLSALLVCTVLAADGIPVGAAQKKEADSLESIESAEAAVMQLMKTEGEVAVQNSSGRAVSLIRNMNLYNGYHTITEESSYAWISLDSEKLTKLDAASEAEIRRSGKKLEILLDSGSLFFDVSEPLTEEETLNVRTSTMVMGIRGTCGWVKVIDRWHSLIYILEGTVQCSVMDPVTGQRKEITLTSGETAEFVVYAQDRIGDKCDIILRDFTEKDIDGFVLVELVQDAALCRKIYDASGMNLTGMTDQAVQRLRDDQTRLRTELAGISSRLENQEHNISRDPVWGAEDTGQEDRELYGVTDGSDGGTSAPDTGGSSAVGDSAAAGAHSPAAEAASGESSGGSSSSGSGGSGSPADSGGSSSAGSGAAADSDSSSSAGSSAAADSDSSSSAGSGTAADSDSSSSAGSDSSTPPEAGNNPPADPVVPIQPPVTMNADLASGSDVNTQLSQDNVNQVVVEPGTDSSTLTVPSGTEMNIPSEKTLTVSEGATLEVQPGATVQVDGTLDIKGDLVNNGTIIVNNGG